MSTRPSRGGFRPHLASQATISSNRPRLPGGLVSSAWRATTSAAAALSPSGRSRHAARSSANEWKGPGESVPAIGDAMVTFNSPVLLGGYHTQYAKIPSKFLTNNSISAETRDKIHD